jgi:hypothetical protein
VDNSSVTISCNELHVFDEDATPFATAEAEFVPGPPQPRQSTVFPPSRPTAEDSGAARGCWLKVIRRFTAAVPRKKNCLRVVDALPGQPAIVIRRRASPGTVAGNGPGQETV